MKELNISRKTVELQKKQEKTFYEVLLIHSFIKLMFIKELYSDNYDKFIDLK